MDENTSQTSAGDTHPADFASAGSTTSDQASSSERPQERPTSEEVSSEMERVKKAWEVEGSVERAELMRSKGPLSFFTR